MCLDRKNVVGMTLILGEFSVCCQAKSLKTSPLITSLPHLPPSDVYSSHNSHANLTISNAQNSPSPFSTRGSLEATLNGSGTVGSDPSAEVVKLKC